MADERDDKKKAEDCIKTLEWLGKIREPYENMVDEILTYIHHTRRRIKDQGKQKGKKTGQEVYDGTAFHALNLLADGLAGYSMSRAFRWFEYTLPGKLNFPAWSGMRAWSGKRMDEFPDVKVWLESAEEVMYQAFLRSNFYDISPEIIKDCASIGTVTIFAEEDVKEGRIIFTAPHFRENFIAENAFGQVDVVYREYKLTLKQLVEKFTLDRMIEVHPGFRELYEKNHYEEMKVLHATYPRDDFNPELLDGKNKPFASMWVLKDKKELIQESGYKESPAITWRWRKNNDEWYGRSPCWDAFVDIMTGNQQAKTNLIAGHKMAEPPMVAPSDLRGLVQSGPKGWTYIQGQVTKDNIPMPLQTGIQLPFAIEMMDRTDGKIREHLFVDFFLMLSQAAMENRNLTATQVIEMAGEKAAVLGPRIGRMETEALNPIHDRVWAIEARAGRIPAPPDILREYAGGDIETDYMGPLSQAQKKLFKSQGIRGGLEALAGLVEFFPQAGFVVNPLKTARMLLEASGFPSKGLRDEEETKLALEAAAKQQQQEEAITQGVEIAKAVPAAGKAPEEGSPLKMLTETAGAE